MNIFPVLLSLLVSIVPIPSVVPDPYAIPPNKCVASVIHRSAPSDLSHEMTLFEEVDLMCLFHTDGRTPVQTYTRFTPGVKYEASMIADGHVTGYYQSIHQLELNGAYHHRSQVKPDWEYSWNARKERYLLVDIVDCHNPRGTYVDLYCTVEDPRFQRTVIQTAIHDGHTMINSSTPGVGYAIGQSNHPPRVAEDQAEGQGVIVDPISMPDAEASQALNERKLGSTADGGIIFPCEVSMSEWQSKADQESELEYVCAVDELISADFGNLRLRHSSTDGYNIKLSLPEVFINSKVHGTAYVIQTWGDVPHQFGETPIAGYTTGVCYPSVDPMTDAICAVDSWWGDNLSFTIAAFDNMADIRVNHEHRASAHLSVTWDSEGFEVSASITGKLK